MRRVEDMAATRRAGAIAILSGGKLVGKIIIAYPQDGAGTVHVNLWDWSNKKNTPPVQYGKASGFGYDKVSAAIAGMTFADIKLTDHPQDYKTCLAKMGFEVITLL